MRLSPVSMTDTRVTRETINTALVTQMLNMGFSSEADMTASVLLNKCDRACATYHLLEVKVDLLRAQVSMSTTTTIATNHHHHHHHLNLHHPETPSVRGRTKPHEHLFSLCCRKVCERERHCEPPPTTKLAPPASTRQAWFPEQRSRTRAKCF
jgi:hypothetical protein